MQILHFLIFLIGVASSQWSTKHPCSTKNVSCCSTRLSYFSHHWPASFLLLLDLKDIQVFIRNFYFSHISELTVRPEDGVPNKLCKNKTFNSKRVLFYVSQKRCVANFVKAVNLFLWESPLVDEIKKDLLVAIIEDLIFEFVEKLWVFSQGYMPRKLL